MRENNKKLKNNDGKKYRKYYNIMLNGMKYCETKLPGGRPRWPKLKELKWYLLGERTSKEPYDILGDLEDTEDCYHELIFRGQDVTE